MDEATRQEWNGIRKVYVLRGPCALCGGIATDCHEIAAGASRRAAFTEHAAWLRVCRECHDTVQGASIPWQLALKLLNDPEYFDLRRFCEVWGRADTAIEAGTVLHHLQDILKSRGRTCP
jgi:hypothetical protein